MKLTRAIVFRAIPFVWLFILSRSALAVSSGEFDPYLRMSDYDLGQHGLMGAVHDHFFYGTCLKNNPAPNQVTIQDRYGSIVMDVALPSRFPDDAWTELGQTLRQLMVSGRCAAISAGELNQFYLSLSNYDLGQHGLGSSVGSSFRHGQCAKLNYDTNKLRITDRSGTVVFDEYIGHSPQYWITEAGRTLRRLLESGLCN